MTRPVLRTDRLELRPMTPEHLPLLRGLDADAQVMRYLIGRPRTAAEVAEFWGPRCADRGPDAVGLGWWVGFAGSEFVGWWDAMPTTQQLAGPVRAIEPEVGWRLHQAFWGQGLATEGAAAVLDHVFGTVGVPKAWAETMAVNLGSRGVMRKLGMRHVRTYHQELEHPLPGSDQGEVVYEITAAEWAARRR